MSKPKKMPWSRKFHLPPYKEKFKHETVVCKKWSHDFCIDTGVPIKEMDKLICIKFGESLLSCMKPRSEINDITKF